MIGICLAAAGFSLALPVQAFTLACTHSIEKIRWEEDYLVVGGRLRLTEARIRGSGAGMEPPADAVFRQGVWHYTPPLPPLERLRLTRSSYTADYSLCWDGMCRPMGTLAGAPDATPILEIAPCVQP